MNSKHLHYYLKKCAILAHIVFASMWVGGALCLVLILLFETDYSNHVWGAVMVIKLIENVVVIPGAVGSFVTGLVLSVFTDWGFFKHRWVTLKWILTTVLMIFGAFLLAPWAHAMITIAQAKGASALTDSSFNHYLALSLNFGIVHLFTTLALMALSVLRPWEDHRHMRP